MEYDRVNADRLGECPGCWRFFYPKADIGRYLENLNRSVANENRH